MTTELMASTTDAARVGKMVAGMAEVFGVAASPERIRGYVQAIADVPPDLVAKGIRRVIQDWRFPDMPKPADIRSAVEAVVEADRAASLKQAKDAERRPAENPMRPFGRMSRYVVERTFGGFAAHESCHCPSCWEAKPEGPPRFVPDGTSPDRICETCDDSGWCDGLAGGVLRCLCAEHNPNLRPDVHRVDMGRWIHGAELVEHEQAQRAFFDALRRVGINRRQVQG
jgi:hypothetical protein